jgi:putative transposase
MFAVRILRCLIQGALAIGVSWLGATPCFANEVRQAVYRDLFRSELDEPAIDDIRLALNQNQPLGNNRFHAKIEAMTGMRREARARGRPRKESMEVVEVLPGQRAFDL